MSATTQTIAAPTLSWEYMYVTELTTHLDDMQLRLTALGSLGWEVVGFASADPTIGFNCYTAMLKRQALSYPAPDDLSPGWHVDPSGRGAQRFWDGLRWSQHVTADGVQSTDYPNVR